MRVRLTTALLAALLLARTLAGEQRSGRTTTRRAIGSTSRRSGSRTRIAARSGSSRAKSAPRASRSRTTTNSSDRLPDLSH